MGFFSYRSYYKPGKGVEKDAPEKNAFFRFFEIYGRKFWRFIEVNLVFFVILLPLLLTIYAAVYDTMYTLFDQWGYTGTCASLSYGNLTVTAREPGASGNDYVLNVDADKYGNYTVTLYTDRGAAAEDSDHTIDTWFELYDISSVDELAEYKNEYVIFSGSGDLEPIHDAPLSGGDGLMSFFTPLLYLAMLYYAHVPRILRILLLLLSILAYGPAKCGVTYVLRNFSRESHSWISDIWDKAKENWKQGMLFGVIDCLIALLLVFNLSYTPSPELATVVRVSKYLSLLLAMFYSFMRKYIYLMIVTVNLNLSSIVKNAWLLAFIGIFRNVFSGFGNLMIWFAVYLLIMVVHPFFEILFLILLIYSFTNFISISACYPLIDKYLVQPIAEMQAAEKAKQKLDELEEEKPEEAEETIDWERIIQK